MRITFLCGSFEPGRDGVGDYVAQLVRGLASLGHACQVIALADRYVAEPRASAVDGLDVMRLPAASWRAGDVAAAVAHAGRFAPDWTSLQMVSYAYEERGLLLRSPGRLAAFAPGKRRHLMLHELWIGEDASSGSRERLVGAAQKWLLLRALRRWGAHVAHTSNPAYRELLGRAGVDAALLPLPGNIPVVATAAQQARELLLARAGLGGERLLLAGVFGALHPEWAEGTWLETLAAASESRGVALALVHVGRAGSARPDLWRALRARHGGRVRFAELGELPPAEVSVALQGLDIGLATTPWALVGKSGAVAAMLEHGLPVAVTRTEYRLRRGTTPEPLHAPGLHRFDDQFLELVRRNALDRRPARALHEAHRDLLASLAPPPALASALGASVLA